jgi:hypothetical protein
VNVERPATSERHGLVVATVAWLAVLGGTIALGLAGQGSTQTIVTDSTAATASPLPVVRAPVRAPQPTRPPIGEDGVMGGLPFGTAFEWLRTPAPGSTD